jgi:hypothetical protein
MKWPIVQSAVLLLTVFGIHLSTGYETPKPFKFPDDDPYYPPAVPFANNPKAPPPIVTTTIPTPKIPAQPVSLNCKFLFTRYSAQLLTLSLFFSRLHSLRFPHRYSPQCTMDVMAPKAVWDIRHHVFNNDPALHW